MQTFDGIASLTNKLANERNPRNTNVITRSMVDRDELRAIYASGIGTKIINIKTGAALDKSMLFESPQEESYYEAALASHVKLAAKFMLAFGRALFVIHEPGADLTQPPPPVIDRTRVRFHVFSGDMVWVQEVDYDLSSPDYFKPLRYAVRGSSIHPARCIDFTYIKPTEFDAPRYFWGGMSLFELIRQELINDAIVQRAVPAMLEKASTLFYKIDGFKGLLASKQESELVAYFQSLESLRSIYGAGIVDKDDEIQVHNQSLGNLAESDQITIRRISMVTGIPVSWFIGEAARGLNSTGENEKSVFDRTIKNLQSDYLIAPINRLLALLSLGPISFKEHPAQSPKETAALESAFIANARVLWEMGEDHTKYLEERGVIQRDDIADFWESEEDEETISSESPDPDQSAPAAPGTREGDVRSDGADDKLDGQAVR